MRFILNNTTAIVALLILSGCSSDFGSKERMARILKDNPELIIDVINDHPIMFLETIQNSARLAQDEMGREQEEEGARELQRYFDKPLMAKIEESRVISGPANAPITIVEYTDFECPFCRRGFLNMEELKKLYAGKIRVIHKNLPLDFHPKAMGASLYFEAIRLQSNEMALAFYEDVFTNQSELKKSDTFLESAAKRLGADIKKLKLDLESTLIRDRINSDVLEAQGFGISGTPSFIVNGVPVKGAYPPKHFIGIINELQSRGMIKL